MYSWYLSDGLCYSYARHITKDIPDDYSSSGVFSSSTITDVIYIDNDLLSTGMIKYRRVYIASDKQTSILFFI